MPDSPKRPRREPEDPGKGRSLEEVFGDVLPDTTRDEQETRGSTDDDSRDEEIRGDVPPHHGAAG